MSEQKASNTAQSSESSNHSRRIEHYQSNFTKVLESFGAKSNYTAHAFFQLQGAIMGKSVLRICEYADSQLETMRLEALNAIDEDEP